MILQFLRYIAESLHIDVREKALAKDKVGGLPFYLTNLFDVRLIEIGGREMVAAIPRTRDPLTVHQIATHFERIRQYFNLPVVLVQGQLMSVYRKRLTEKRVNFVIPGKQLYLPDLAIALREIPDHPKQLRDSLLPSAQVLVLWQILRRTEGLESFSLMQLASKFNYTPMAITNAVSNLARMELCTIVGRKEKRVVFDILPRDLWSKALPHLRNPVVRVFTLLDEPNAPGFCTSNLTAFAHYTQLNEPPEKYVAVYRRNRQAVITHHAATKPIGLRGDYYVEVWSYDPEILATTLSNKKVVDPLSLYLTLRETPDERIEKALQEMIEETLW